MLGDQVFGFKRRAIRGAVTVEALLVLKVVILVWVATSYLGQAHLSRLESKATARSCAWEMAANGCREVPQGCESALGREDPSPDESDMMKKATENIGDENVAGPVRSKLLEKVRGLFVDRATITSAKKLSRPDLWGGGEARVGGRYSLPCNTIPESLQEMTKRLAQDSLNQLLGENQ